MNSAAKNNANPVSNEKNSVIRLIIVLLPIPIKRIPCTLGTP